MYRVKVNANDEGFVSKICDPCEKNFEFNFYKPYLLVRENENFFKYIFGGIRK